MSPRSVTLTPPASKPPPASQDLAGTTLALDAAPFLPRFRFSTTEPSATRPTLSDHAFLYVASGNDTPEYAESYGTDAVNLHHLLGARSLIFARTVESALQLGLQGEYAIERLQELNTAVYKLPLSRVDGQHDFVIWSGERTPSAEGLSQAIKATWELADQRGRNANEFIETLTSTQFNQLTSIQVQHISGVIEQRRSQDADSRSVSEVARLERVAECALRLNDKAEYWRLIQPVIDRLPRHVPTALVSATTLYDLLGDRDQSATLRAKLGITEGAVVIKSALEAGGECCAILRGGQDDNMQISQLIADLLRKGRNLEDTPCLIQRCIVPPESDLPARIGILGSVGEEGIIEASTQVYSDPDRRTYLGSYWSEDTAQRALESIGIDKVSNLLEAFGQTGYCGPIGFDAMLDSDGGYTLIYDANPRLTSVAAVLMVRDALRNMGVSVTSAVSLGHHGNWVIDDAPAVLRALEERNQAFTGSTHKGLFLVPNSRGKDHFDVYCINCTRDEISEAFNTLRGYSREAPSGIYF
jgi:hypothetical protein